jgi:hypothetical protein
LIEKEGFFLSESQTPLARLVLFIIYLAVAGAIVAGFSCSLQSPQVQDLNTPAPTNDIIMTGGGPGPDNNPFQFQIVDSGFAEG